MSDLISRSELLKRFAVGKDGHRIPERYCDNFDITVSIKDIKRVIKEQPTAYDIDKVVEQLEKLADESYKEYCIAFNSDYRAEYDAYTNAIEIVKQGVVDDVCEWKLDGVYLFAQHNNKPFVSCVIDEGYRYNYCPICGKKIMEVE